MNENVGARPWQTFPEELFPLVVRRPQLEHLPVNWRDNFYDPEAPWSANNYDENTYLSPNAEWGTIPAQIRRLGRAVAVDMASVKLFPFVEDSQFGQDFVAAVERLTGLMIEFPHAAYRREEKTQAAAQIRNIWQAWGGGPDQYDVPPEMDVERAGRNAAEAAARAALALAHGDPDDEQILDRSISLALVALAPFGIGWGAVDSPDMRWPFRYSGEASRLAGELNEAIALWWSEVISIAPIARGTFY